jgi:FKBP-type peptidyl-prolyl cis-trans isomerase FkpA
MNQFLKAFGLIVFISFFTSCKKDDDSVSIAPPRDYAVQYASEKDSIEKYLKNHHMVVDQTTFDVTFDSIRTTGPQVSIWDQTDYPLRNKLVTLNNVQYTLYYLSFREGAGNKPTRGDDVLVAYNGTLLNDKQFEYAPFPQVSSSLAGTIEGWQEIIPLFGAGTPDPSVPASEPNQYLDYGAGVMFLPSDFAYYNTGSGNLIGAYQPLVFSFKLYAVQYTDLDGDTILNKDEIGGTATDVLYYDTDGDGIPNYLDADDDGDGFTTKTELRIPGTTPFEYYTFDNVYIENPDEDDPPYQAPCSSSGLKPYLDPTCHPVQ